MPEDVLRKGSPSPFTPSLSQDFRRYRIPVHENGNSLTVVLCLEVGKSIGSPDISSLHHFHLLL